MTPIITIQFSRKFTNLPTILAPLNIFSLLTREKHWDQQFRKERQKKILKVLLPDFDAQHLNEKLSVDQIRSQLKEKGIAPHRLWKEKPMYISCTGNIVDPYVPPEGDGKMSFVAAQGLKQLYDNVSVKGRSYLALKKIHNLDYEFDIPTLAEKGKEVYIEAQKALAEKNEDKLLDLVTEKAFVEMMDSTKLQTIRWNFIQSLEPPRIVHIRCQEMISKSNIFAQVTLRLFSQQTLAVYDRFGRLIQGSEETLKDVLEYVVFEKHLTIPNGSWKIHGKIIPDRLQRKKSSKRTSSNTNKNLLSHLETLEPNNEINIT